MIEISQIAYDKLYEIARNQFVLGIDGSPSVEDLIEDIAHGDIEIKNRTR